VCVCVCEGVVYVCACGGEGGGDWGDA